MIGLRYHIAICDDETAQAENLRKIVMRWIAGSGHSAEISLYNSAESFLFDKGDHPICDILLLDIQMGGITGVELAKRLRDIGMPTQIIFITAFADYITEGYDVDAVHYLMKPVQETKLGEALNKAAIRLSKTEPSLLLPMDGEMTRIQLSNILYIECFAHYQEIHAVYGQYKVKMPIYALEKLLDESFIRCHRSYMAGLKHIVKITKTDVILDNNQAIPLSRRLYEDVNKAFIRYFMGAEE